MSVTYLWICRSRPEIPRSLHTEQGVRDFQAGILLRADEEWCKLVPAAFFTTLTKDEVQRQSIMFEIIQSERDYVADIQAVHDVRPFTPSPWFFADIWWQQLYIEPLKQGNIIPRNDVELFTRETFFRYEELLSHHQRMLEELYAVQLEQHQFISSISGILLDSVFPTSFFFARCVTYSQKFYDLSLRTNVT